ncbi:Breast cancer suppressor protein BRCT [Cordyceps fumosorosea ARSEF 2679]|uniref:Breast cancer suppressor protein BRCT n=1 Tax=Cordyceps fumosorosea (strain ARSEF 2679) TaxID=1081104 RepID=A0A167NYG8_CORFA|nr:Breast cancer suppressor protein BRCT [Cordyceps fumosorosea ARSEF 2679]OAA56087.1 Breast cancer suppressor protein BRCT [Cordyceps fumosorosea ARSEF 2679]
MDSPPKRITRARAAASTSTVRTTRIVTAAARAKAAAAAAATNDAPTATKRKTRADEHDDDNGNNGEENEGEVRARRLRGRPSRAVDGPATALRAEPVRATTRSTRSARIVAEEPAPSRPARGRPRRNTPTLTDQPPATTTTTTTTTTRRSAAAGTRTRAGSTASKTAPTATTAKKQKKSVKFDEPGKENLGPAGADAANAGGLLHAAAARRPPTPAASGRKRGTVAASVAEKTPLSPKKVTQIPVLRKDGDDLASNGSSRKSKAAEQVISLTPIKKSVEPAVPDRDQDSTVTVNAAILGAPEGATMTIPFGSPPRRPPTSPNRDTLKSPAKKMGAIPFPGSPTRSNPFSQDNATKTGTLSKSSTLLQTPAKRPPSPIKGSRPAISFPSTGSQDALFKASLFQSPAKRAPMLGLKPVPERPAVAAICETPAMKPIATVAPAATSSSSSSTSVRVDSRRPSARLTFEDEHDDDFSDELATEMLEGPSLGSRFNGRLSDVVPRDEDDYDVDDGLEEDESVDLVHSYSFYEKAGSAAPPTSDMTPTRMSSSSDSTLEIAEMPQTASTALPAQTPLQGPNFQLRDKDADPCHDMTAMSDSDDEGDVDADSSTFTPSFNKNRRSTMGLTSLAQTLGAWSSEAPARAAETAQPTSGLRRASTIVPVTDASPSQTSFFEEQMQTRAEEEDKDQEDVGEILADNELSEPSFDEDIQVTCEDLALAQEAEDMSQLHESPCAERSAARSFSDSLSEASQEYGDENELPVDPALHVPRMWPPTTPVQPVLRTCSTTTKVPLKPADESSPTKARRFSASRIPNNGTGSLPKSATVISYSPEKPKSSSGVFDMDHESATPTSKCDMWSNMGTPARTPRRDTASALLRGAVVFVDVHTSEGADASLIFVDLLTQMGAKCVKTWSWNPDGNGASHNVEASSNKIGITHVVFKDGGKRTMEKVRKSVGMVQCVGVSWVLDCEKENAWLDEGPYLIDTAFVPRGGARRRKSMEPKALANNNGTLVSSTPAAKQGYNRRQSGIWMQTPPEQQAHGGEGDDDIEWSEFILTPVPKTPTPETISRYATEEPETPSRGGDESGMSLSREEMLMRTCPPAKPSGAYDQLGAGVLSTHKDEKVLIRLMAARRKSLQFAPKIGSPLSKSWY